MGERAQDTPGTAGGAGSDGSGRRLRHPRAQLPPDRRDRPPGGSRQPRPRRWHWRRPGQPEQRRRQRRQPQHRNGRILQQGGSRAGSGGSSTGSGGRGGSGGGTSGAGGSGNSSPDARTSPPDTAAAPPGSINIAGTIVPKAKAIVILHFRPTRTCWATGPRRRNWARSSSRLSPGVGPTGATATFVQAVEPLSSGGSSAQHRRAGMGLLRAAAMRAPQDVHFILHRPGRGIGHHPGLVQGRPVLRQRGQPGGSAARGG
jgi:hypothetical protein